MAHRLVLASGSTWRREMLARAGVIVECCDHTVDEGLCTVSDPVGLARALAQSKARSVTGKHPDAWIIGADQVASFRGECFGKPRSPEDHLARLAELRGETHALATAFTVVLPDGSAHTRHEVSHVTMRGDLSDAELRAYVETGEGSGSAGGYVVEGLGANLIAAIDGDWFNVVGLPLYALIDALRALGWRPTWS